MTEEAVQSALLKWFWQEPEKLKSLQQIENRCRALSEQFFPERPLKNAKYAFFYPLLRFGLIEFYGADQFGLAPTCALRSESLVLLVNLPDRLKTALSALGNPLLENSGYQLYPASAALSRVLEQQQLPCRFFSLESPLGQLPSLLSLLRSWEKDTVIDDSGFLYFDHKWVSRAAIKELGIFKKSGLSYAQRLCRLGANEWRVIPPSDQNPDAFYHAVLWDKTHVSKNLEASYHAGRSTLVLKETFFPMLLERLLIINSLLQGDGHDQIRQRHYRLSHHQFRLLNQFLNHSIPIAYE